MTRQILFVTSNCWRVKMTNLHTHMYPQLSIGWRVMSSSSWNTWMPSLLSRRTSVQAATSLGQTPSIYSGMRLQETCRGPALCLDSPFRPPGTGALIRSVGSAVGRDHWDAHSIEKTTTTSGHKHTHRLIQLIPTHLHTPLSCLFLPDSLERSEVVCCKRTDALFS